MAVTVEVWGDYACFSRPEMKTERVSYDIITPSAARGLLESIFFHPGLNWIVDKIYVLAPIDLKKVNLEDAIWEDVAHRLKMTSIKRNEVKSKLLASNVKTVLTRGEGDLYLDTSSERNQRSSLIIQNPHYVIEAHFEMTSNAAPGDNPGKFQDIMKRRLKRGQCYHQPYLGCREFPAHFREWEKESVPAIAMTKDLGYMLHSMDYSNPIEIRPRFFRALLTNGVLDLRDCEVVM